MRILLSVTVILLLGICLENVSAENGRKLINFGQQVQTRPEPRKNEVPLNYRLKFSAMIDTFNCGQLNSLRGKLLTRLGKADTKLKSATIQYYITVLDERREYVCAK